MMTQGLNEWGSKPVSPMAPEDGACQLWPRPKFLSQQVDVAELHLNRKALLKQAYGAALIVAVIDQDGAEEQSLHLNETQSRGFRLVRYPV
jgi:hypothetical protein